MGGPENVIPAFHHMNKTASMQTTPWQFQLDGAPTEEEVVAVAKDYLATWTPQELAFLPEDCRPGRIRDGADINAFSFKLAQALCSTAFESSDASYAQRMLSFFAHAAVRISQIATSSAKSPPGIQSGMAPRV